MQKYPSIVSRVLLKSSPGFRSTAAGAAERYNKSQIIAGSRQRLWNKPVN